MLTKGRRRNRMELMEDALPRLLSELIGQRSVLEVARASGVNYPGVYAILDGRSKRPGPDILMKLAHELVSAGEDYLDLYDRLALAAYCRGELRDPAGADDTLEEGRPPASNAAWNRPGTRRRLASGAT